MACFIVAGGGGEDFLDDTPVFKFRVQRTWVLIEFEVLENVLHYHFSHALLTIVWVLVFWGGQIESSFRVLPRSHTSHQLNMFWKQMKIYAVTVGMWTKSPSSVVVVTTKTKRLEALISGFRVVSQFYCMLINNNYKHVRVNVNRSNFEWRMCRAAQCQCL